MTLRANPVLAAAERLWNAGLDLVFPPRCVSCKAFGSYICPACRPLVLRALPPRCEVCWLPEGDGKCPDCRYTRPAFRSARSAFIYEGPARDAVLALKFNGLTAIAATMATPMAEALALWSPPVQAIVPVPLAGGRQRARGYNQSQLLAKEIGRILQLPVVPGALVRTRSTAPQARERDRETRSSNVAGAFSSGRRRVEGGVLLVDDVITTGATLSECARVLLSVGSGPVYALTYARED